MSILKKIDSTYKKKQKKVNKMLNIKNNYLIKFDKKEDMLMHFYDKNNNKVLTANYNFYGIVTRNGKFTWANMIQGVNNEHIINTVKQIKTNTGLFKDGDSYRIKFYRKILENDNVIINGDKELEWINKLLTYLNNDVYFINSPNSHNKIQIFGLTKVMERFF